VGRGTVRTISLTIRNLLGVDDLDTAVELVQDRLVRYRETLPLSGRCKQRPPADGSPLSEPLLAVLRLTADGRRPRLSGHRSSSGQRQEYGQSTDAPGRRPPRSREPARRRPEGPGNGAPPVRALVSHRDRPAVAFRSGRQRCGVLSSDQASGQPAISGWASSVCHAACSVPSPRPPCRTRASPNVEAARQRNRRPAPLHQGGEVLQHGPRRSPLSFRLRALSAEAAQEVAGGGRARADPAGGGRPCRPRDAGRPRRRIGPRVSCHTSSAGSPRAARRPPSGAARRYEPQGSVRKPRTSGSSGRLALGPRGSA
jgi:hypothetical protein